MARRHEYAVNMPMIDGGPGATFERPLRYADTLDYANPHYHAQERMGCCVPSDNPNMPKWTKNAPHGTCANLYMKYEQCCGPSGHRCVHDRNTEYDKLHGYNLFFPKK